MALIDSEEGATKLARAIVSDIELYNADAMREEGAMVKPVSEGRGLFRARVVPELHSVFEQALANSRLSPYAGAAGPVEHPPVPPPTRPRRSSAGLVIGLVLFMAIVAFGILGYLASR